MRIHRRLSAALAAVALLPALLLAQENARVTGRVTNASGGPESAVQVRINALNAGGVTGPDGSYSIVIPGARVRGGTMSVTVTASRVGLASQSRSVQIRAGGETTVNFQLSPDVLRLEELVVTGAGTEARVERLGVARAAVDSAVITRANETNVIQALAGRLPNVVTNQASGEAGASTAIRIRGPKTITGTGQPLIVVDGVPILNATRTTGSALASTVAPNRASDINPQDIESIEVLKGPAATSIYGATAGSGGAILITTKRGRPGRTSYSLNSSVQFDEIAQEIPLQRRWGVGSNGNTSPCATTNCFLSANFFSWGPELAAGVQTYDQLGQLYETGQILDNTLTVSGGSERTTFYLSLGALNHDGYIRSDNDTYDRYTVRFNGSHQMLSNLTVGARVSYVQTEGSFVQRGNSINGLLLGALRQPPEFNSLQYLDPTTGLHRSWRFPNPGPTALTTNRGFDNPFYALYEGSNTAETGRAYGNVNLDWRAMDWLRVQYTLGADYSGDDRLEARPVSSSGTPVGGSVIRWQFTDRIIDSNLLATADYTLRPWWSGSITAGQNLSESKFRQVFVQGNTLIAPRPLKLANTVERDPPTDAETRTRVEGYFLQASADLWDQLFLTAAIRNDGSSTFGEDEQRAWYPKASAAWTFTDAVDLPGNFITSGKLRAAYGVSGQQPGAYLLQDIFTNAAITDFNPGSTLVPTLGGIGGLYTSLGQGNALIKPERNAELEFGLDLSVLDDRADLSVTYYDQQSKDVIYAVPLAPSTGFTSQSRNSAEIENKGWEVAFNVRPIRSNDWNLDLGFVWARNRNELISLGDSLITVTGFNIGASFGGSTTNAVVGEPLGVFRGTDFARCGRGLTSIGANNIAAACEGQPDGALYISASGLPIQDPTDRTIGDPNPDWTGGVNAVLGYRNLRVSAFLDVRRGGQTLNMTKGSLYQYGTHADTEIRGTSVVFGETFFEGETVVGPGAGNAVTIGQTWFSGLGGVGGPRSQFMEDASFTRLREVTAAYTFDQGWVKRLGLSSVEASVSGRNLKLWTDYTGFDPEINAGGAAAANRGVDWFVNPLSRAWVISLSLNR